MIGKPTDHRLVMVTPKLARRYPFDDPKGCPLFKALQLAGLDVRGVWADAVMIRVGGQPRELCLHPYFDYDAYLRVKKGAPMTYLFRSDSFRLMEVESQPQVEVQTTEREWKVWQVA